MRGCLCHPPSSDPRQGIPAEDLTQALLSFRGVPFGAAFQPLLLPRATRKGDAQAVATRSGRGLIVRTATHVAVQDVSASVDHPA